MANEKEIKQLETLVESMKSASDALVKSFPSGSLALKYMSDDIKVMIADLKSRPAANESAQARELVLEELNKQHQENMRTIGRS